jgi:hypothetical protein
MRYQYKPSFSKIIGNFSSNRKEKTKEAIRSLVAFFETGQRTQGLGLKKLKREFWEIRSDLRDRILFRLKDDLVEFVICGNHNEIRRFLKNI